MTVVPISERFTRAFKGLISPPSEPPGEIMSFGVSPVNYSDADSNPHDRRADTQCRSVECRNLVSVPKFDTRPGHNSLWP